MKTKIISMTEHSRGDCEVVIETPTGEVLTLGFNSSMPIRDEEHYSTVLTQLIDKYYEEQPDVDLFNFLFRFLLLNYCESPIFVRKDKNLERDRMGKRIREIREAQGMDAKTLALRSGIDAANLCRIEQGRYSAGFDILTKIAQSLGYKLDFVPISHT